MIQILNRSFIRSLGILFTSVAWLISPTPGCADKNPKEPVRELSLVRWGLIPSWAKDPSADSKMINARSETAGSKPAFRDALKSRRVPGSSRRVL